MYRFLSAGSGEQHKEHRYGGRFPPIVWALASRSWLEIPIHVFVIEHRAGLLLFDAGLDPAIASNPAYVNSALARPALIKAAHAAGKEFFVWTVNDALSMSQMMSLGVDGIITDLPALGHEVLEARAELSTAQRLLLHMAPVFGIEMPSLGLESNDADVDGINSNLELGLQQQFQDRIALSESVLQEFTTDGCSGGLSVVWDDFARQAGFFRKRHGVHPPWEICCIEHDRSYHRGGGVGLTAAQAFTLRERADQALQACVLDTRKSRSEALQSEYGLTEKQFTGLYQTIADGMYAAVRLGGMPCTGLSWRWGYGWPDCS